MEPRLEHIARTLIDSGDYRIIRRLGAPSEYHRVGDTPASLLLGFRFFRDPVATPQTRPGF